MLFWCNFILLKLEMKQDLEIKLDQLLFTIAGYSNGHMPPSVKPGPLQTKVSTLVTVVNQDNKLAQ